jgi:foldase protein PrsA
MKSLRIVLVAALAASLAFGIVGCQNKKDVAAEVNGEEVPIAQLETQVAQLKKQYPEMFTGADGEGRLLDFKQRLLDNMINQKLIEQAAKEKGIAVSDADVDKQIKQLKAGFKDDAQFQQALTSAGMTEESLRAQIRDQLVTQKIIDSLAKNATVTDAEMQAYYTKNKVQYQQKAAKRAEHILFKPEDKKKAQEVLDQVNAGGDFGALAKKYSIDTATASKGGDLGWPTTAYVPEFETALAKLKKGETSALVKTPYGYHIIRVTDTRKASQQTFEEVKDQIQRVLLAQKKNDAYTKFLDALRAKAKIEILAEDLKASNVTSKTPAK